MSEIAAVAAATHAEAELVSDGVPYPVPPIVLQLARDLDWEAFLPPHARSRSWRVQQRIKRVLDIVAALALLIVLSPLLALIALAVKLTSPGPLLYRWKVLSLHARPFIGYKFRTMVVNADELKPQLMRHNEMTGPVFKMRSDPRVTPIGRFLRKYSLDELPQLWSVLRGDMSLVGPRPAGAPEFAVYEQWMRGKLAVVPGMTCLWQINGRSHINDFDDWMRLDREYVQNWSLWLDLKILLRTIPAVLRGEGAY